MTLTQVTCTTETIDRLYLELSQFTTAKTKRELEGEREKERRVYYQDIVYAVCNQLDRTRGSESALIVCGTVEKPSTEVQDVLKSVVDTYFALCRDRDRTR